MHTLYISLQGDDNLSVYGELLLEVSHYHPLFASAMKFYAFFVVIVHQSTCFVGAKKGIERQVLLFEKLLLILKKNCCPCRQNSLFQDPALYFTYDLSLMIQTSSV